MPRMGARKGSRVFSVAWGGWSHPAPGKGLCRQGSDLHSQRRSINGAIGKVDEQDFNDDFSALEHRLRGGLHLRQVIVADQGEDRRSGRGTERPSHG